MYDPLLLGESVARRVCDGERRLYHRFRPGRFYGGSAAADVVGCNLRCAFCWSWRSSHGIPKDATAYAPQEVASRLVSIARRFGYHMVRITGGEPTLCPAHLMKVIKLVNNRGMLFILETNGMLIGRDKRLAQSLSEVDVFVRVSIKAPSARWFSKVTGAIPAAFELQLDALKNLVEAGVEPPRLRAAVVVGYGTKEEYETLLDKLESIHPELRKVEPEVLVMYPSVKRKLRSLNLIPSYYRLP